MAEDVKTLIETIDALAPKVCEMRDGLVAACNEENAAEAELLDKLVQKVKPALRALSSRIIRSKTTSWVSSVETASESEWHDERGVFVCGDAKAACDHRTANRGSYVGRGLVLLSDGRFAAVDWSGNWSRWQGESDHVASELSIYQNTVEVADEWSTDEIVETLSKKLEEYAKGGAGDRMKRAKERAEKVRALTTLL